MFKSPRKLSLLTLLAIAALAVPVVAGMERPRPVVAAVCPDAATEAPTLDGVDPDSIDGEAGATITVSGEHFEQGAIVVLGGYGALSTTCVSDTLLTATVPAGIPGSTSGRTYSVKVITSQGESNSGQLTVTETAPTATPEPTATDKPTSTPVPTGTPVPTAFVRPILTVQSYGASSTELLPGQDIDFEMTLQNTGQLAATNVIVTFQAGDLIPRTTGGVKAIGDIGPGQANRFFQPFTVSRDLASRVATLTVEVSYTDTFGTAYSAAFDLTFTARPSSGAAQPTATPTPTPGPVLRPQLVIEDYGTDADQLQPGTTFTLTLTVRNLGSADAQGVTMIVGGGSAEDGGEEGTPTAGGVAGGSGEFSKFAPIGSSNVQYLGDLAMGASLAASQTLVVNVSTDPGAYPFKISFTYTSQENRRFTDDQVVTLLVYAPPQLDVSFYRDPNPIFAGQPGPLPLQINNLGKNSAVLGNMVVSAEGGTVTNDTVLVGRLDPGGFFTTDAVLMADQPGPLTVTVTLHYTDDFNHPQTITKTLEVRVEAAPEFEPGMGPEGGPAEPLPLPPETIWQKIWRFIRGLLGLDSARRQPGGEPVLPGEGEFPPVEVPPGGGPVGVPIEVEVP